MPKFTSAFEYDVIPFTEFPIDKPITVIREMNDGYCFVIDDESLTELEVSSTAGVRGGVESEEWESLSDFLFENHSVTEMDGDEKIIEIEGMPLAEFLQKISQNSSDNCYLVPGVLRIKELSGSYCDPEKMMAAIYGGTPGMEDDDEDEEEEDEEDGD